MASLHLPVVSNVHPLCSRSIRVQLYIKRGGFRLLFLYLVRMTGLDLIKDRLGPALAGGARPRRIEWVQVLSVHAEIRKESPSGLSLLVWCG